MNVVKDGVINLAYDELQAAVKKYGEFASYHEAYAVILEEVEEAEQELYGVCRMLNQLWEGVRCKSIPSCRINASGLKTHAINLACEAIQIAAMCEEFKMMEGAE